MQLKDYESLESYLRDIDNLRREKYQIEHQSQKQIEESIYGLKKIKEEQD